MKKFCITGFALLYVVLIVTATGARSSEWATRESGTFAHRSAADSLPAFGKLDASETRVTQTKIFETGFVIESPLEVFAASDHSEQHVPHSAFVYFAPWSGQPASSRAPPLLA